LVLNTAIGMSVLLCSPAVIHAQSKSKKRAAAPAAVKVNLKETPNSPIMLAGDWVPENTHKIDYDKLPRVPGNFRVVSEVRDQMGVNQHNYIHYYAGKYWIMWSDGPGIEDRVGQRVKFSTSPDGLNWSAHDYITPNPPGAERPSWY